MATCLSGNDLAHQAGRFIAQERSLNDALSLEKALHDLRISEHEHHRRMAYAVPPYLQHLLHSVSATHYTHAYHYDMLVERLLRLPFVCFLTLNYDVLLDRRLAAHHDLGTFDDYIGNDKNWALIKLHGSVNWFYTLRRPETPVVGRSQPPELRDEDLGCLRPDASLQALTGAGNLRYPAIALPEGPDDRLVLPTRHLWWLHQVFDSAAELDLLVIGYSGLDTEILTLIRDAQLPVRHMTIVNQTPDVAEEVRSRFVDAGIKPRWSELAENSFGRWADSGGLDKLVAQFGGPYPDAK